jgi:hypothetical protein
MPTMSIEELADLEMADAMERQQKDADRQAIEDNEDEDRDSKLRERNRQEEMRSEDWKDDVPKGRGNTKRI